MKKQTAWNGFYKTVKEIQEISKEQKLDWRSKRNEQLKMCDMKARRYAKSLVREHGWEDVHTKRYITK